MITKRLFGSMAKNYEILGLEPGASIEKIKSSYNTLVKKYHPDTTQGNKKAAEEKFKQIHEAKKELLSQHPDAFIQTKSYKRSSTKENDRDDIYSNNKSKQYSYSKDDFDFEFRYEKTESSSKKNSYKENTYSSANKEYYYSSYTNQSSQSSNYAKPPKGNKDNAYSESSANNPEFRKFFYIVFLGAVGLVLFNLPNNTVKKNINHESSSFHQGGVNAPQKKTKRFDSSRSNLEIPVDMKLTGPIAGTTEFPSYITREYLYRGQTGPHKIFLLLSEKNNERGFYKCQTCQAVISKSGLETHVRNNQPKHSIKRRVPTDRS
jgi:curved DNA-binding protein CbpA